MSPTTWRVLAGAALVSWLAAGVLQGWGSHDADMTALVVLVSLIGADVAEVKERHRRALARLDAVTGGEMS